MSGYVPSPLNWSHLAGRTWSLPVKAVSASETEGARMRSAADGVSETLPTSYDLREEMPPVRDQTYFNNCWTYSATAATESNLIKKGLAGTDIDLSEWYITYYALNPWKDMVCFANSSGEPYYMVGGNDWKSVALLSRGTGSVTTAKAPDITSYYEYDYADKEYYEFNKPRITTVEDWKKILSREITIRMNILR